MNFIRSRNLMWTGMILGLFLISLTIAKNDLVSKVTNVYSFDDKLAVIGISEEEGKTEVKDTVIINSSITNDLSVLSDLMRDTIKNIKGIE